MKKFFLALCCAAFLFPCEKSFATVCDSAAVLNENTTEMVLKARLAGLAKDLNAESYGVVNDRYLSRDFKSVLDRARKEEAAEAAEVAVEVERRLRCLYCDNNIWADVKGCLVVDIIGLKAIGRERYAARVRFAEDVASEQAIYKTCLFVYENDNWYVSDIILADSPFGGYSVKYAIMESLSMITGKCQAIPSVLARNLMSVYVNENDGIMVIAGEEKPVIFGVDELDDLRQLTKAFITANTPAGVANENFPQPKQELDALTNRNSAGEEIVVMHVQNNRHAIVLEVEPGAGYDCYTKVVEALYGAYNDLRNDFAAEYFATERLTAKQMELCVKRIEEAIIEGSVPYVKKAVSPAPEKKKVVEVIRVVEEVKEENELIPVEQQAVDNFADTEAAFVEENEDKVYDASEVAPQFPGGMKNLMDYLKNNLKYPRISRDHGSQGRALVKFVVNTDGTLQDIEVFKSTGDTYLDQEAVRLVKLMPRWTPGRQLGKAVRVKFVLPINFRLK